MSRASICLFWLWLSVALLRGQEQLQVFGPEPATLKLGETSQALLSIEGSDAAPKAPQLPQVDGLQLQLGPPSQETSMYFDGRSTVRRTAVKYQLLIKAVREGTFVIPEFEVFTGTKTQKTRPLRITAVKDMRGEDLGYLDITVQPERVYVHEPIRIRVEFGVDAGLRPVMGTYDRGRYFDFEVQAPWLSQMEGAEPLEMAAPPRDAQIVVLNQKAQPAEYDPDHERRGKRWQSFVYEKSFLPTRVGTLDLPAPLLRYDVLSRDRGGVRTGLFGERMASQTENYYVYGKALKVEVLPIPETGRPNPYYGAVGRFTVAAALDRTDVKVGNSLKVTFRVQGKGNFEFFRVPALDALPGFHKLGQTEKRATDGVTVTYDLTPLDASVQAVPPIAWNFFDTTPGVEKFVEVATPALPVLVKPLEHGETLAALPDARSKAVTPGVDDVFDLRQLDTGQPARFAPGRPDLALLAALLPWALGSLGLALRAWRRRRLADVSGSRARGAARNCARQLAAGQEPGVALTQYLADRLGIAPAAVIGPDLRDRLLRAGVAPDLAEATGRAIEDAVSARYGGGGGLDQTAVQALIARLEPQPITMTRLALFLGVLWTLAALAPPVHAQAETGVAAYRRGDYEAAKVAFEQALAAADPATVDRRLWFDLGNCFYRQHDLARALWAYESARLGMPRDPELLANLRLVRRELELGDGSGEPFLVGLTAVRERFTANELTLLCGAFQLVAALCLLLGWRRRVWRGLGFVCLGPGVLLAVELVWLGPARPGRGICTAKTDLVAEPRESPDLPKLATVRQGVEFSILGRTGTWLLVAAGEHKGYVPSQSVAEIR